MADCVPVKFSLRGKISGDVFVLGSWDGWSQATKLDKSDETLENSTRLSLPCGYYEYKFKIGDHWIHDNTKPTVVNKFRTLNNFVHVMKPPDIAISDASDQPEITVDFNPILQATEEPLPLIPKLYEAAPKENQDGDEESAFKQSVEEAPEPPTSVTPTSDITIDAVTAKVQTGEEVETTSLRVADEIVKETEQVKDTVFVPVVESSDETSVKVSLVEDEHGNAKVDNIEASETAALQIADEIVKETEEVKDTVDVPVTERQDETSVKVSIVEDEHGAAEVENVETPFETTSLQVADDVAKETEQVKDTVEVPVLTGRQDETSIKVSLVEDEHGAAEVGNVETPETTALQVSGETVKETEQVKDTVDVPVIESPEETSIKVSLVEDEHGAAEVENVETPFETTSLQVSAEIVKTEQVKDAVEIPVIESPDEASTPVKASLVEDEHGAAEVDNVETPSEQEKSSSDARNIAERVSDKSVHQEEIAADENEVKLQKEIENAAVHEATKIEGGSIKTERQLQQEIADYLARENDNVPEMIATKETVDQKDNASNDVQDTIEKVADDKIVPQEEHRDESVERDPRTVPDDETLSLEKRHTVPETKESVSENQDKTPISAIKADGETGPELVQHQTEKYDHKVIQDIPESKDDCASDEVTKVLEERTLQEEEKAPILPQSEPVSETVQPVLQEQQPEETTLETLDKHTNKAVPLEETPIKTAEGGLEIEAFEPVVERQSLDEIPIEAEPNVQEKVAQTVSKETEKHDNVTQDIPEIKEDTTTDEVPPQKKGVETDKEQEKEATSLDNGSDKTNLQQGNQKLDETAPPKEAANHVETMVDDVVKEITKTAIQEAGKTSPQQETVESAAMQDLEEKTQEKLTKEPAKHEIPNEAEVEVTPHTTGQEEKADMAETEKDKAVEDVTGEVKGADKEAALPQVHTKADVTDYNMTEVLKENLQDARNDKKSSAVDIEKTTQNTEVEVTPSRVDANAVLTDKMEALTEILHEKEKDEKPVVVDVGKATQLEPDAPTYAPDITDLDKTTKKTTIETKVKQEDDDGLESMHKEEVLPEDETTKDVVSNLEKEVEKPSPKAPVQEKMSDTVVIEKVEKEKDKALGESPQKVDKAMKEADKIVPVDGGKEVQDRVGLGDLETSPTKEIGEHVIFDKAVSDEYKDAIEEKTSVAVSEEQKGDKTEVLIETKPVEEATSKVILDNLGADIKPQEEVAVKEQTIAKPVTGVEEEPSNQIQVEDNSEKREPPSETTKISQELEDVKSRTTTKERKELPTAGGSEIPILLLTEKQEKPLKPESKKDTKKKEDAKSRLPFWKKDKTSAEQEKSTPEKKPTREVQTTKKEDQPKPQTTSSKEEAKKKEGPTSRLSFLKKKKKEEPTVQKQTEKSKPETEKPSPEEPTTKTEKAKTSNDDTKPQGFMGILRCCRCF
ncbi:protein P200-like [Branchiostoma floridae]|uniref:Protein P200-like n=1 Tax=Branchiostoma floridae TaxID=7739 RepID=A0A9J7HGQ1_BRAFL|nr:protein P200-like [Branchiostoma floridae]